MGFMCRRFSKTGCCTWFLIGRHVDGVSVLVRPVTLFLVALWLVNLWIDHRSRDMDYFPHFLVVKRKNGNLIGSALWHLIMVCKKVFHDHEVEGL